MCISCKVELPLEPANDQKKWGEGGCNPFDLQSDQISSLISWQHDQHLWYDPMILDSQTCTWFVPSTAVHPWKWGWALGCSWIQKVAYVQRKRMNTRWSFRAKPEKMVFTPCCFRQKHYCPVLCYGVPFVGSHVVWPNRNGFWRKKHVPPSVYDSNPILDYWPRLTSSCSMIQNRFLMTYMAIYIYLLVN